MVFNTTFQQYFSDIMAVIIITAKANKILSFLRRNLQIKQEETKSGIQIHGKIKSEVLFFNLGTSY